MVQPARCRVRGVINIFFAGVDLGSTMTKIVIIDEKQHIIASIIRHTGAEHRRLANQVMKEALDASGSDMVTVALRRVDIENEDDDMLAAIDRNKYLLLPRQQ